MPGWERTMSLTRVSMGNFALHHGILANLLLASTHGLTISGPGAAALRGAACTVAMMPMASEKQVDFMVAQGQFAKG
jgi:hypothetical protein